MLNVGQLNEGFVLDHIEAGKSMMIYNNLGLGELDCQVAIIKNARSSKMGRKDIIKIEGGLDLVDLDVLGFIDHNITVNIIKNGEIVEKKELIRAINSFLDTLSQEKCNIFLCRYWHAIPVSEIATRFGMSEGNVSVTLTRIRIKLKNYLKERGYDL